MVLGGLLGAAGCSSPPPEATRWTESVYSKTTGRLEQIRADVDRDGRMETVAFMDGTTLKHIEIDRDGDGQPDRWEYYGPGRTTPGTGASQFDRWAIIVRAEEASRADAPRLRRELYEAGVLRQVEEDTDLDGRMDKWESYRNGELATVDLDLRGKGFPDRRLVYRSGGDVDRIERDLDGDGRFEPMPKSDQGPR